MHVDQSRSRRLLEHSGEKRRNIILAALAELSARYLRAAADTPTESEVTKRKAS